MRFTQKLLKDGREMKGPSRWIKGKFTVVINYKRDLCECFVKDKHNDDKLLDKYAFSHLQHDILSQDYFFNQVSSFKGFANADEKKQPEEIDQKKPAMDTEYSITAIVIAQQYHRELMKQRRKGFIQGFIFAIFFLCFLFTLYALGVIQFISR